ncbi:MAG TPA: AAA family ATPase [Planctomycetota bacterium]|nr:AAA family ATPase [Planctomycetota bacterium]
MYEAFYNFKEKPFNLTPDPDFLYLSPGHRKALAYLKFGLESGEGFVLVTGEIGSGKTTLVRSLLRSLHPNARPACVVNPKGTFRQLMRLIMADFAVIPITEDASRERLLAEFERFVRDRADQRLPTVVIIDEAQNIDPGTLEELRMLSNLETEKKKLVQIVLVGQPELRRMLQAPELEQFNQRIAIRYHLDALSPEDTAKYIRHRLEVAGGKDTSVKFSRDACEAIYAYSRGVPRKINVACNAVLIAGLADNVKSFNGRYVREAIADVEGLDRSDTGVPEPERRIGEQAPASRGNRVLREKPVLIGAAVGTGGLVALIVFAWSSLLNLVRSAFHLVF